MESFLFILLVFLLVTWMVVVRTKRDISLPTYRLFALTIVTETVK